jgi:tRNA(Ile)-lysidine synthase
LLSGDGGLILDATGLPREIKRRVLLRIIDHIQPGYVPRGDAADRALDTLNNGERQMLGNILCEGGETWRFRPAPRRQH